jgi:hypothetical protein
MEKRLENLVSQADKLIEVASEERRKAASRQLSAEVESTESERFNHVHIDRPPPFHQRYPMISGLIAIAAMSFIAMIVYMKIVAPRPIGSYRIVNGSVKSTRFTSARTTYGGHLEVAEVVLPDGRIITARVESDTAIAVGTVVPLRMYEDGAIRLDHPL